MKLYARKPMVTFALSMLVVALLPLCFGWVFYARSSQVVESQQRRLVEQSMDLTLQIMDRDITAVSNVAIQLRSALRGLAMPDEKDLTVDNRLAFLNASKRMREALAKTDAFIDNIYMTRADGLYAVSSRSVLEKELLYKRYFQPSGLTMADMDALHQRQESGTLLSLNGKCPVFVVSMKDKDTSRTLVLLLSERYLSSLVEKCGLDDVSYYLQDKNGKVILSREVDPREDDRVVTYASSAGEYELCAHIPLSRLSGNSAMLRVLYVSMLGATLLLSALLICTLSRRVAMPINDIISQIRMHTREDETWEGLEGLSLIENAVSQMIVEQQAYARSMAHYQEHEEMHRLSDALLGLSRARQEDGGAYVVACFPFWEGDTAEKLYAAIMGAPTPGYLKNCACIRDVMCLLLEKQTGAMNEDEAARALEDVLAAMDDGDTPGRSCAMSMVHTSAGEIETAYQEAGMACDVLPGADDCTVMRFDTIRYTPEYFMRDWRHLDKQMTFARLISSKDYRGAVAFLPEMFPEEFLCSPRSTLAKLHLSSLKFQFLHDVEHPNMGQGDADEINRTLVREIIGCKTHQELLKVMQTYLQELSEQTDKAASDEDTGEEMNEVKAYIRRHSMDAQLSVAAVAEQFGLTANTLSKQFSRKTDMGVLQYIHRIRIENACNLLLADESTPIADIAARVGYTSILTFNRAFKARYQMTPSEYRKVHHNLL